MAFAPPIDEAQQSLNAKSTRREVADQNKLIRTDEPTSSVCKCTTVPQSVSRKSKDHNRSKKHQFHAAIQLVAPSANNHCSPDQFVDTTDDELDPAQKLAPYAKPAAHPITGGRNCNSTPLKLTVPSPILDKNQQCLIDEDYRHI